MIRMSTGLVLAVTGFWLGYVVGFVAWSQFGSNGTLDACRAANPGYECVRGWVKGEPFK